MKVQLYCMNNKIIFCHVYLLFLLFLVGCISQPTTEKSVPSTNEAQSIFLKAVAAHKQGDYTTALVWFRKAAVQGHAEAQSYLGWMYHNGKGVTKNYQEAIKWYRKAAEQGNADAQKILQQ
jgi:TPR repeat protein